MRKSAIDIWVGLFVVIGLLAAFFLALKVGNMNAVSFAPTIKFLPDLTILEV
jgi:phospholipid/cholesterol/gamma-HCH transport system substrate-binding protein